VTAARDLLAEVLAGHYSIERELGHGGMATVYLARDLQQRRRVAVKAMLPDLASALGAERFRREMAIAGSLDHPLIVPLYDSGQAGDVPYYIMPTHSASRATWPMPSGTPTAVGCFIAT
jgi:serine/threonine protein kinase